MSSNFLNDENKGDIIIYQSESGETKIDVRFQDETVWLTQAQMEELFQSSHANVVEHIKNIYSEGELDESLTCRKFRQVRREGNRNVERERLYYNLDMIISLGYRIKSFIATQFRRWATERLKEYMIKGFAMLMCGLKENKAYCKPIIKHCNRKQPLQEKKQGKKHRRKRKRKAAKWSYNGNIFL